MNKVNKLLYFSNLCFFLYFIILIPERIISVTLSLVNNVDIFHNAFYIFVYLTIILSIVGWMIYLLLRCKKGMLALFNFSNDIPFKDLCIASGILLLSGMVHSEYTASITQFVSYGILIIGILLKVISNHKNSQNKLLLWLSFIYLVAFSMAIPVSYHSHIELHVLFHILEGFTSYLLVGLFTYLLILLFNDNDNLFILWIIIVATILDTALIILRWNEEINYFVLIFISLSLVLFIIGFIVSKKRGQNHD